MLDVFLMILFLVVNPACWFVLIVLVPRWSTAPIKLQPITKMS